MNRQDDIMIAFNKTWKANHPNMKKNNDVNNTLNNSKKIDAMMNNIKSVSDFQRKNNLNNILKKWK